MEWMPRTPKICTACSLHVLVENFPLGGGGESVLGFAGGLFLPPCVGLVGEDDLWSAGCVGVGEYLGNGASPCRQVDELNQELVQD